MSVRPLFFAPFFLAALVLAAPNRSAFAQAASTESSSGGKASIRICDESGYFTEKEWIAVAIFYHSKATSSMVSDGWHYVFGDSCAMIRIDDFDVAKNSVYIHARKPERHLFWTGDALSPSFCIEENSDFHFINKNQCDGKNRKFVTGAMRFLHVNEVLEHTLFRIDPL